MSLFFSLSGTCVFNKIGLDNPRQPLENLESIPYIIWIIEMVKTGGGGGGKSVGAVEAGLEKGRYRTWNWNWDRNWGCSSMNVTGNCWEFRMVGNKDIVKKWKWKVSKNKRRADIQRLYWKCISWGKAIFNGPGAQCWSNMLRFVSGTI